MGDLSFKTLRSLACVWSNRVNLATISKLAARYKPRASAFD